MIITILSYNPEKILLFTILKSYSRLVSFSKYCSRKKKQI